MNNTIIAVHDITPPASTLAAIINTAVWHLEVPRPTWRYRIVRHMTVRCSSSAHFESTLYV